VLFVVVVFGLRMKAAKANLHLHGLFIGCVVLFVVVFGLIMKAAKATQHKRKTSTAA
jgi:hypothetical protein